MLWLVVAQVAGFGGTIWGSEKLARTGSPKAAVPQAFTAEFHLHLARWTGLRVSALYGISDI
jgi:hypothetical protein